MHTPSQPLALRHRVVGPWQLNSYAVVCPETRHSLLVDPGDAPDTLAEMVAGSRVQAIVVTHGHPDHIGALEEMQARLGAPVLSFGAGTLQHGLTIPLGRHSLRVYHTPGHTADQVCLEMGSGARFLVGDTLFEGGPGKTWSAGDFKQTLATLRGIVLAWPETAVCYPGHGSSFCLGDIRRAIQNFVARDHGDFYGDATWEMQ